MSVNGEKLTDVTMGDQQPSPEQGKVQRLSKARGKTVEASRVGRKPEARGSSTQSGVYCIENKVSGRRYIGCSVNLHKRFICQRSVLNAPVKNKKQANRLLYDDVQKYGWDNFDMFVLEVVDSRDRSVLQKHEAMWMDVFSTRDPEYGYNLRMDDECGHHTHEDTRTIVKERHSSGLYYTDEWRRKISERSSRFWSDNPDVKKQMSVKVAEKKRKYKFHQYTKDGQFVRTWQSIDEILTENPIYKAPPIYSVCDGWKKSYRGFVWRKELKI